MTKLSKCPKQQKIVEYLMLTGNTGKSESEIVLNVYKIDRSSGSNNKAAADTLRRALRNGFIKRREVYGKRHIYEYYINI